MRRQQPVVYYRGIKLAKGAALAVNFGRVAVNMISPDIALDVGADAGAGCRIVGVVERRIIVTESQLPDSAMYIRFAVRGVGVAEFIIDTCRSDAYACR